MRYCGSLKRAQKGRETCPFRAPNGFNEIRLSALERMAGTTRLELATSAVTVTDIKRCRRTLIGTTRYRMSLLIVPLLYPDLAELRNFPADRHFWRCQESSGSLIEPLLHPDSIAAGLPWLRASTCISDSMRATC